MSLNPDPSAIYRAHPGLSGEVERRDVVFRFRLDAEERKAKSPWIMSGRTGLASEEEEVWRQLGRGELSEADALGAITTLMERYYGSP